MARAMTHSRSYWIIPVSSSCLPPGLLHRRRGRHRPPGKIEPEGPWFAFSRRR